jgi:hypothetical protein
MILDPLKGVIKYFTLNIKRVKLISNHIVCCEAALSTFINQNWGIEKVRIRSPKGTRGAYSKVLPEIWLRTGHFKHI